MHIKCQASDMLSLVPVLHMYCSQVLLPLGLCKPAVDAFMALCYLVQVVWCSGRAELSAASLDAISEDFLAKFEKAFGYQWMVPKHHWLLHLGDALEKNKCLPNCFSLERRHRFAKQYADALTNISKKTSESLLMEVTCPHISKLQAPLACCFEVGLLKPHTASKKIKKLLLDMLDGVRRCRSVGVSECQNQQVCYLSSK